jgi:hypothetical protein
MSSSDVVFGSRPIGGLAALSGAVLFTIFDVLSILLFAKKENFSVIAATGSYALFVKLSLLTLVLIQVGLVGLYVPHSGATDVLGLVGFLVTFLGMALAAGSYWAQGFVAPAAAQTAPEFLDDEPAWLNCGFTLTLALLSLGWLLFGVAMLRARIYPRIAAILLMIGAVVSFLPLPGTELVLIVAIAWLGFALFAGRGGAPVERPARVS